MIQSKTQIRVRYGETDQMGFLYYGHYALYYEVARSEMIREAGYPYSEMEKDGTVMPVVKMNIKYLKAAKYDELITVETTMTELHKHPFVTFYHKLYNEQGELINKGEVTLTFYDLKTEKRVPMPERLRNYLTPFFKSSSNGQD
ncbi:MAG: acyl-CoA thioesterase [Chitinophagaceae bacterium]|nr:acyl-CoA thioesterase [Chitinophagaceae bacterium]